MSPRTVLARIDPERYRLEAQRAEAVYRKAQADQRRAEADFQRREELAREKLVAAEELNRARGERGQPGRRGVLDAGGVEHRPPERAPVGGARAPPAA